MYPCCFRTMSIEHWTINNETYCWKKDSQAFKWKQTAFLLSVFVRKITFQPFCFGEKFFSISRCVFFFLRDIQLSKHFVLQVNLESCALTTYSRLFKNHVDIFVPFFWPYTWVHLKYTSNITRRFKDYSYSIQEECIKLLLWHFRCFYNVWRQSWMHSIQ